MRKTFAALTVVAVLAALAWAAPAPAKEAAAAKETASQDAQPKGKAMVAECLAAHEAELSEACAEAVDEMQERQAKRQERFNKVCGAELASLCKDPASAAEPMKCLQAKSAELKGRCAKMVQRFQERQAKGKKDGPKKPNALREACKSDIAKLCRPGKKGKGGKAAAGATQPE